MANKTMNNLDPAGAITGAEVIPGVQSGNDVTIPVPLLLTYVQNNLVFPAADLSTSSTTTTVTVASSTGTDAVLTSATGSAAGVLTAADKSKLDSVQAGATANSSDATLLARPNHTGVQPASTISDFSEAVDDRVSSLLVAGSNVTLAYDDVNNTLTITSIPGVGTTNLTTTTAATTVTINSDTGTDATIAAATTSAAGVMTAADKTKLDGIQAGATANSADSILLARPNHTGVQPASTISDFSEAVDDRVSALLVAGTNITLNYNDPANTLTVTAANTNLGSTPSATNVSLTSSTGTGATIAAATTLAAGVMTAADKTKLDNLNAGAGLTLTGSTFDVGTASSSRIVVNADSIDLATVADSGLGSFVKITRDNYGRITGTQTVVVSDITSLVDSVYVNIAGDTMSGSLTSTAFIPSGASVPSNGIFLPTSNTLGFSTSSTEQARLTSTGQFIVGDTSGQGKLTVKANSADTNFADQAYPATSSGAVLTNESTTNGCFTALTLVPRNGTSELQTASVIAQSVAGSAPPNLIFSTGLASAGTNVERLRISGNNGDVSISTGSLSVFGDITQTRSANASIVTTTIQNTSNTASSGANLNLSVAGALAGDPTILFTIASGANWILGSDNSDSDAFVISASNVLGTSNALRITTAGAITVPGSLDVAGATSLTGGVTVGDVAGDPFTINSSTVSIPNGLTLSGGVTVTSSFLASGGATLGDAAGDALTIGSAAVTWTNSPVHSGVHRFSDDVGIGATAVASVIAGNAAGGGGIVDTDGTTLVASSFATALRVNRRDGDSILRTAANFYAGGVSVAELQVASNGSMLTSIGALPLHLGSNNTTRVTVTSAGDLSVGSTAAMLNAANRGNVSVNGVTDSIVALGTGGTARAYFYDDGTNLDVWNTQAGFIRFGTSNLERVRIDSSGNVGIGTASPAGYRIRAVGPSADIDVIRWENDTSTITGLLGVNTTSGIIYTGSGTNNPYAFIVNGSERARIDTSGNLGIGSAPDSAIRLDVTAAASTPARAALRAGVGQAAYLSLAGNGLVPGVTSLDLQMDSSGAVDIVNRNNTRLSIYTNAIERVRIDNSGRFLLGTTTVTTSSAQSGEVKSTGAGGFQFTATSASNPALVVLNEGSTGSRSLINFLDGPAGGVTRAGLALDNSEGLSFIVQAATKLTLTTGSYVGVLNTSPASFNQNMLSGLVVGDGSGSPGVTVYGGNAGLGSLNFADGSAASDVQYRGTIEYDHSTDRLYFRASGTRQLYIASGGVVPNVDNSVALGGTTARFSAVHAVGLQDGATGQLVSSSGTTAIFAQGSAWSAVNIRTGGTTRLSIDSSGNTSIGTGDLEITRNTNSIVRHIVTNTNNAGNSGDVELLLRVGGASAGDSQVRYNIDGVQNWSHGVDNDDSDSWVLCASDILGINNVLRVTTGGAVSIPGTLDVTGTTTLASGSTVGGIEIGYRSVPVSSTTTTAVVGDRGKCISLSAGITIPASTFAAGDAVSLYNNTAGNLTITQGSGLTLRLGGTATTGNRTLAPHGLVTIWFLSATEGIMSGSGVS